MAPTVYSFETGLQTEQDYDAALALMCELRNSNSRQAYANLNDSMLKLACMIEKFERERYLIFNYGYVC